MISIIESIICAKEGLMPNDIHVKSREQNIVFARQLIMYYSRKTTLLTFKDIGKYFDLDYSTVINSCHAIDDRLDTDKKIRNKMEFYNTAFGIKDSLDGKTSILQFYGEIKNEMEHLERKINTLRESLDNLNHQIEKL